MGARVLRIAGLSVALIFAGIALPSAYGHWIETRTFVPLDVPVSLSRGHIKTPDFYVNVRGWYEIWADVDPGFPFTPNCGFGLSDPVLRTHSTLYSEGHAVEQSEGHDHFMGHFHADKKGRYRLDVEVLSDASCFNTGHPRITVWTAPDHYEHVYDEVRMLSVLMVLCGLGLLAFAVSRQIGKRGDTSERLSIDEGPGHGYHPSHRKRPLKARFAALPAFGLAYTFVLIALLLPSFGIFIYSWGWFRRSVGIPVSVLKTGVFSHNIDSSSIPPVVRIDDAGVDALPNLYVNSRPVLWGELASAVRDEIKLGPDWVVYVEADQKVSWADVMNAIDIIRGTHAKVVLLTTETTKMPSR
jgi:biopolymer transport protein ExbD